jgi:uncharacterized caspase-like protein
MAVPRKRAAIIGVNEYKDPDLKLTGAVNDATELRDRLKESGDFEIADEHFLLDKDATSIAIRKAISDLLWKDDASDISLFYFSGHGLHDEYGNGYLAPHDIDPLEPLVCGIRMQELTHLLLAAKNKKTVLAILDCCYSGAATASGTRGAEVAQEPPLQNWFDGLRAAGVGEGRVVLASSGKDQKARERCKCVHEVGDREPHDHGAFTFHLLEGIDGKAVDDNGAVTLRQLQTFLDSEMQNDPHHKMSSFASTLIQAQKIILARPSQWANDQATLNEIVKLLEGHDPYPVLVAARRVRSVLDRSPRLQRACELEKEINERLQQYSDPAISWLTERMFDLFEFQTICGNLQAMAARLTALNFNAEKKLQGLMTGLCRVAVKKPDSSEAYLTDEAFVAMLRAQTSSLRQPLAAAKPQKEGQKLN